MAHFGAGATMKMVNSAPAIQILDSVQLKSLAQHGAQLSLAVTTAAQQKPTTLSGVGATTLTDN